VPVLIHFRGGKTSSYPYDEAAYRRIRSELLAFREDGEPTSVPYSYEANGQAGLLDIDVQQVISVELVPDGLGAAAVV
jgi:hypothetical protein